MAYARKRDRAASDRRLYLSKREWMRKQKDVPCADCGHRYPAPCMDFDHVRGRKKFAIGQSLTLKLSTLKKEIAKCDVVCANCHRLRTHKRRRNGT